MNLFRIIALIKQIDPPPDLYDEETYRAWFIELGLTVTDIAELVDDPAGTRAAKMVVVIGTDNELWTRFHGVLIAARERIA